MLHFTHILLLFSSPKLSYVISITLGIPSLFSSSMSENSSTVGDACFLEYHSDPFLDLHGLHIEDTLPISWLRNENSIKGFETLHDEQILDVGTGRDFFFSAVFCRFYNFTHSLHLHWDTQKLERGCTAWHMVHFRDMEGTTPTVACIESIDIYDLRFNCLCEFELTCEMFRRKELLLRGVHCERVAWKKIYKWT